MPAIAGATLISLNDATWSQSNISIYFAGFISAAVSGYLALKILKKALDNSKFHYFGYYTGFLSLITLLLLS